MSLWNNSEDYYKSYPSQLTDNLYIAAARALSSRVLFELGITSIVNATIELPTVAYQKQETLQVAVEDKIASSLYVYFDLVADKINEVHNSGGKILVYCRAGQSRSAALCMAYFIKYHKLDFDQAFQYVKARRPIIHPNIGFVRQLKEFREKCKKRDLAPIIPPPVKQTPIVNGSVKEKAKNAIRPFFTKECKVENGEEHNAEEMEEIVLSKPDSAQVNVHQNVKQVALRFDAHIIKFNDSISFEIPEESKMISSNGATDINSNHIPNGIDSDNETYPISLVSKTYPTHVTYSNIPLETELPASSNSLPTKGLRKKKKSVICKPFEVGLTEQIIPVECTKANSALKRKMTYPEASLCSSHLTLPISKFDVVLQDTLDWSRSSSGGLKGNTAMISFCDNYLSVANLSHHQPLLTLLPKTFFNKSSGVHRGKKVRKAKESVIVSETFPYYFIVSDIAQAGEVETSKAGMSVVGIDACFNPSSCQASISPSMYNTIVGPGKPPPSQHLSGYAMKTIKPLNDRIRRLQKFASKTSSGVKDGAFEKKGSGAWDPKHLNLATCKICEPCIVTEVIAEFDLGVPREKTPSRKEQSKVQMRFRPAGQDKLTVKEENPLAKRAEAVPHRNYLFVALSEESPQVEDDGDTLEDIPEEIQNFQYLKFVLANDSNQAKCNIWLDVYKRTMIRMKPTYPTVSYNAPLVLPKIDMTETCSCLKPYEPPPNMAHTETVHGYKLYTMSTSQNRRYMNRPRKTSYVTNDAASKAVTPVYEIVSPLGVAMTRTLVPFTVPANLSVGLEVKIVPVYHESPASEMAKMTLMPTIHKSMDTIPEVRVETQDKAKTKTIYYSRDRTNSRQRLRDLQDDLRDRRFRSSSRQRGGGTGSDPAIKQNGVSRSNSSRFEDSKKRFSSSSSYLDNRMPDDQNSYRSGGKLSQYSSDYSRRISYPDNNKTNEFTTNLTPSYREDPTRRISYVDSRSSSRSNSSFSDDRDKQRGSSFYSDNRLSVAPGGSYSDTSRGGGGGSYSDSRLSGGPKSRWEAASSTSGKFSSKSNFFYKGK